MYFKMDKESLQSRDGESDRFLAKLFFERSRFMERDGAGIFQVKRMASLAHHHAGLLVNEQSSEERGIRITCTDVNSRRIRNFTNFAINNIIEKRSYFLSDNFFTNIEIM